jgi:hypothetical protein
MLGHVLSQLQQKVGTWMVLCRAKVSQMKLLCKTIIARGIDRMILIVQYIKLHLAKIKPSIERCRALLTKVVQLIKVAITLALHKLGLIGLQLQIIAHKIHQRVLSLLKRGN